MRLIEQPLPPDQDAVLEGFDSPIPIAADESCQTSGDVETVAARYEVLNIKLDKTGGLTEALRLAAAAREAGCSLVVGNMAGTSLAMAPSFVIAQSCAYVDLDGPLLLRDDRAFGMKYDGDLLSPPDPRLWG